jgi:transcriptional antiterminator NusG
MQRYVVHVYSGYESYVKKALTQRIQQEGLTDFFGEILIPTEKVVEMKSGKKRESERKFYPGYVVVQMEMDNITRKLVSNTPKVLGFLGGGTADKPPMPISEKEADIILQKVQDSVGKPKPKVLFSPGEVIRVNEGPFADFNGVVEEVNYEKNRLRVAVLIFGRSTPVDLDFSQVEKT